MKKFPTVVSANLRRVIRKRRERIITLGTLFHHIHFWYLSAVASFLEESSWVGLAVRPETSFIVLLCFGKMAQLFFSTASSVFFILIIHESEGLNLLVCKSHFSLCREPVTFPSLGKSL